MQRNPRVRSLESRSEEVPFQDRYEGTSTRTGTAGKSFLAWAETFLWQAGPVREARPCLPSSVHRVRGSRAKGAPGSAAHVHGRH